MEDVGKLFGRRREVGGKTLGSCLEVVGKSLRSRSEVFGKSLGSRWEVVWKTFMLLHCCPGLCRHSVVPAYAATPLSRLVPPHRKNIIIQFILLYVLVSFIYFVCIILFHLS